MLKLKNSLKSTLILVMALLCLLSLLALSINAEDNKIKELSKSYSNGAGNDVTITCKNGFDANVSLDVQSTVVEVDSAGTGEVKVASSYAITLMSEGQVIKPTEALTISLRKPSVIGEQKYRVVQIIGDRLDYLMHTEENGYATVTVEELGKFVFLYQPPEQPITSNPWVWVVFGVIITVVVVLAAWIFIKGAKNKKTPSEE